MGKFSKIMEKAGVDDFTLDVPSGDDKRSTQAISLSGENLRVTPVGELVKERKERGDVVSSEAELVAEDLAVEEWEPRFYKANYGVNSLSEIFKTLRSRILLTMKNNTSAGTIMVTSAMPGEGKSFVAANLSLALASGVDQYVLLVDGDLRRSSVKKIFGRKEDFGLTDYLRDRISLEELIVRSKIPKLSLLLAGETPSNPAELLSSVLMKDLIAELSSRYMDRTIIFDTPPVVVTAEARMLAHHVDGVVLVVRQGVAGKVKIEETIEAIGPDRIIGIVFNDHTGNYFTSSSKYEFDYAYE